MTGLVELIRAAFRDCEPVVEPAVFDTVVPELIETALISFVETRLGNASEALFYKSGVGVVAGLRLTSGRDVVVKVHRWNVTVGRLAAVQRAQTQLADTGLPVPRPLTAPQPLGAGLVTVEELRAGGPAVGHDPTIRQACAAGLYRLIHAGVDPDGVRELGMPLMIRPSGAALWFEPHDLRFDFEATAPGAEWIDDLATTARRTMDGTGPLPAVVGHFDWRVQNLGFAGDPIVGIYDCDSLAIAPEPIVVGNTAAIFTADWASEHPDPLPSLAEMQAFVADYERHRLTPFTPTEKKALDSANLFACAYGARCQHSDRQLYPAVGRSPDVGWLRLLRERGEAAFQ
jgi:hypothetical protein